MVADWLGRPLALALRLRRRLEQQSGGTPPADTAPGTPPSATVRNLRDVMRPCDDAAARGETVARLAEAIGSDALIVTDGRLGLTVPLDVALAHVRGADLASGLVMARRAAEAVVRELATLDRFEFFARSLAEPVELFGDAVDGVAERPLGDRPGAGEADLGDHAADRGAAGRVGEQRVHDAPAAETLQHREAGGEVFGDPGLSQGAPPAARGPP